MRRVILVSALLVLNFAAASEDGLPKGELGDRLGELLTIEGVRSEQGLSGTQTLIVDTVSGKKLDMPIHIWIDNVELPKAARCILRGYESGRMIAIPDEVVQAEHIEPMQAAWQFQHYFIATSIAEPKDLTLKTRD